MTGVPYRLPKTKYPQYLQGYPELKGVCIGECIANGDWWKTKFSNDSAHAHNEQGEWCSGWICVAPGIPLHKKLMLHELAHILTPNRYHDDRWRKKVLALGGTLDGWEHRGWIYDDTYHKKPSRVRGR